MPAFNFHARFADDVEAGRKPCTIRADRKDGRVPARVGDRAILYTGMRTKSCRCLGNSTVTAVRRVLIVPRQGEAPAVYIAYERVQGADLEALARRDGFESVTDFIEWFDEAHGLPFAGHMIEWDPAVKPRKEVKNAASPD